MLSKVYMRGPFHNFFPRPYSCSLQARKCQHALCTRGQHSVHGGTNEGGTLRDSRDGYLR